MLRYNYRKEVGQTADESGNPELGSKRCIFAYMFIIVIKDPARQERRAHSVQKRSNCQREIGICARNSQEWRRHYPSRLI
jgi:hypothetical protein